MEAHRTPEPYCLTGVSNTEASNSVFLLSLMPKVTVRVEPGCLPIAKAGTAEGTRSTTDKTVRPTHNPAD
ncbi:MAG: hypothetical protein JWM11_3119 [Planctomycetaceae bacterium]|nr:hypothetical protein [Planctomycetaceae bacterium]